MFRRALAVAWLWATSGCLLGDVALEGKACPCVSPYVCDEARNVCVTASGGIDASAPRDAELGDAIGEADATEDAGAPADSGEPADTGIPSDSGEPPADTGALSDTGIEADSGALSDTGVVVDSGILSDTGVVDSGILSDTGVVDSGIPSDTGVPLDTGVRPDTGIAPDTGIRDTGVVDTGIVDAGIDAGQPDAGGLPLGTDCTLNTDCASNFCLSINTSSVSTQQFCSTPCSGTSDCPLDLSCIAVNWMGFCLRESVFTPPLPFDVPSGGACTQQTNMCQSAVCNTGSNQCIERCFREGDCAGFGNNCWTWPQGGNMSICFPQALSPAGAACTQNANCASGICDRVAQRCSSHCCSDADCPAAETCAVYDFLQFTLKKICRPRVTNGAGTLGQICNVNADCESEQCVAQNPNGTGMRRCSTLCCENSDCSALPGGGRCWPLNGPIGGTWVGSCLPN